MKMTHGLHNFFFLNFPDMDKYYRKFTDYPKLSLAFHKNCLISRFSKFSMNPVQLCQLRRMDYPSVYVKSDE